MTTDPTELTTINVTLVPRQKTTFFGDVLKLVSGTTLAQAISFVLTPLITRLYAPEAYGTLAIFLSITGIFTVIICMRYDLAIMLPESDEEAINLLGVSLGIAGLLSLITVPILWLGGGALMRLLNAEALSPYLWLIPLMVVLNGVFSAQNYWNTRTKHFGRLSIARIVGSVTTQLANLSTGYLGYATGGSLIGGTVGGQGIATVLLGIQIWKDDWRLFIKTVRWPTMRQVLKRYRKFPLYSTWAALLNAISWQLPVFLLSSFFSSTVVGYYALGFRILQMPMNLIGSAIAQVFFQRAAEAKVQGALAPLAENAFRWLVAVALFPMLMLTIIGRDFYTLAFGQNWAEAGVYTQLMSIWAFFWFTSSPLSTLFSVLEKQEFDLRINVLLIVTRFISLIIGGAIGNPHIALLLFASSGILVYGYQVFAVMRNCGVPRSQVIRVYLSRFLSCLPYGAVVVAIYLLGLNVWVKMFIVVLLFGVYVWRLVTYEMHLNVKTLLSRAG